MDWQDIKTAPEDEKIIVFVSPDWVDTAFFVFNEDTEEREWFWNGAIRMHPNHDPTFWQQLPAPPEPPQ